MSFLVNFVLYFGRQLHNIETFISLKKTSTIHLVELFKKQHTEEVDLTSIEAIMASIENETSSKEYIPIKNPILGTYLKNNTNYYDSFKAFLQDWQCEVWHHGKIFEDTNFNKYKFEIDNNKFYFVKV